MSDESLGEARIKVVFDKSHLKGSLAGVHTEAAAGGRLVGKSFSDHFLGEATKLLGPAAVLAGVVTTIRAIGQEATAQSGAIRAFNSEMTGLLSLGSNLQNFQGVESKVKNLSSTLGIGTGSVAGAMFAVESAAANLDKEVQSGIVKSSLVMQKVTGEDLSGIIRATTKTFQNYGSTLSDVDMISNKLFKSAELGDATFGQLADRFPNVAAAAKVYNRELDETLGAFSIVTRQLGGVEVASTALIAVFRDVDRAIQSGVIKSTGDFVTDVEKIAALGPKVFKSVFSDEALKGAQSIAGYTKDTRDYIEEIATKWEGVTEGKFFERLKNPGSRYSDLAAMIDQSTVNMRTDPDSKLARADQASKLSQLGMMEVTGKESALFRTPINWLNASLYEMGIETAPMRAGKDRMRKDAKATGDPMMELYTKVQVGDLTVEQAEQEYKAISARIKSEEKIAASNEKASGAIDKKAEIVQAENDAAEGKSSEKDFKEGLRKKSKELGMNLSEGQIDKAFQDKQTEERDALMTDLGLKKPEGGGASGMGVRGGRVASDLASNSKYFAAHPESLLAQRKMRERDQQFVRQTGHNDWLKSSGVQQIDVSARDRRIGRGRDSTGPERLFSTPWESGEPLLKARFPTPRLSNNPGTGPYNFPTQVDPRYAHLGYTSAEDADAGPTARQYNAGVRTGARQGDQRASASIVLSIERANFASTAEMQQYAEAQSASHGGAM